MIVTDERETVVPVCYRASSQNPCPPSCAVEGSGVMGKVEAPAPGGVHEPAALASRGAPMDSATPPGSAAAIAAGCTCPVYDNCRGLGYLRQPGVYVQSDDCPLHGIAETTVSLRSMTSGGTMTRSVDR